ncbi:hypothetical protein [Nocardia rhamnosiphila]
MKLLKPHGTKFPAWALRHSRTPVSIEQWRLIVMGNDPGCDKGGGVDEIARVGAE